MVTDAETASGRLKMEREMAMSAEAFDGISKKRAEGLVMDEEESGDSSWR